MSWVQASIFSCANCSSDESNDRYNWVSSAYRWKPMSCFRITSAKGSVYNRNSNGPRTDPCGSP